MNFEIFLNNLKESLLIIQKNHNNPLWRRLTVCFAHCFDGLDFLRGRNKN